MASGSFPEGLGRVGSLTGASHCHIPLSLRRSEQTGLWSLDHRPGVGNLPPRAPSPSRRVQLCLPRHMGRDRLSSPQNAGVGAVTSGRIVFYSKITAFVH